MTVFNTRSVTTTTTITTTTTATLSTATTAITTTATTIPESMSEGNSSTARQLTNAHGGTHELMPSNILDGNVVFPVGSVLECRNVLNSTTVGQVICSDQPNRLLVLRDTTGPGGIPLVRIVNLALVAQVTCLKDKGGEQSLPWPNLQISTKQVQERMNRAIARKKASIMQTNVSIEGQRAFIHLRKTLEHRVEWSGNDIKVLNRVLVQPPYTADSIEVIGDINDTAVASAKEHVRKIKTSLSIEHDSDDDNNNDNDDMPQLSAEAMNALVEFYAEMNDTDKITIEEDWQLSQFWYSEETASKLTEECTKSIGSCGRIACISCPTLLDYLLKEKCVIDEHVTVTLFEYDHRFETKFSKEFVPYDYRKPLEIPELYRNAFDLIVIDPPFLSDECFIKVAQTVRLLSRESSTKLLICTGLIMAELVERLFHAQKCKFQPSHEHNLANEFACYTNYEAAVL